MGDETQKQQTKGKEDVPPMKKLLSRRTHVYHNGIEVPRCPMPDVDSKEHIKEIMAMKIRDDDLLIAAYPKCGTHWTWEVVQMLVNNTTDHCVRTKEHVMMEFCPVSTLDAQDSPRILNSHLYFGHLPVEMMEKKTKIIHVVRNPKDVMVSMFHHFKSFMELTWPQLVDEILSRAGNIKSYFQYLHQFVEFQKSNPDHPIKLVYYEDMKKDPSKITREIRDFLGVDASDDFCQKVIDACAFDQLKQADAKREMPQHLQKVMRREADKLYRKGIIGDWKNQFTVAENERFDAYIKEEMADLPFTFTYL